MENLCFGANFYCDNIKLVEFGNNVKIGNNVSINTTYFDTIKKEMVSNGIKIGDNVVIGNNVVISYGVTINNNAIVMDGSVVLRDVLENEVVSGNPINTVSFNKKEEINLDDVIIYDLDNVLITKDSEANLYLVLKSNNKRILISKANSYNDIKEINNVLFILGSDLNVIDLNLNSSNIDDYKICNYYSSYYMSYLGVEYYKDNKYKVLTDDGDIILTYVLNGIIKFKRLFEYEITDKNLDEAFL